MPRLLVGPFNRVEGDLEVTLDVQEGRVASARAEATDCDTEQMPQMRGT